MLSSTISPVISYEETIILQHQKANDDANNVKKAETNDFNEIQKSINDYKQVSDEYKFVISQIKDYNDQLNSNQQNVGNMDETLAQTQREVSTALLNKRTNNVKSEEKLEILKTNLINFENEHDNVTEEIKNLQKRIEELTKRKNELENCIERTKNEYENLKIFRKDELQKENEFALHQESLQKTRSLMEKGNQTLSELEETTSQRLLQANLDHAKFLVKFMDYINELIKQFNNKIDMIEERIKTEKRNLDEISKIGLKMDKLKVSSLITDYQTNLASFNRRKEKIVNVQKAILSDYEGIQQIVGQFGRELQPLPIEQI